MAPVSWFVQQHVAEGRKQLNFSEWLTAGETRFTDWNGLEKVCVEMRSGAMPLPGYTSLHKDAELSEPEKKAVCAWVDLKFQEAR